MVDGTGVNPLSQVPKIKLLFSLQMCFEEDLSVLNKTFNWKVSFIGWNTIFSGEIHTSRHLSLHGFIPILFLVSITPPVCCTCGRLASVFGWSLVLSGWGLVGGCFVSACPLLGTQQSVVSMMAVAELCRLCWHFFTAFFIFNRLVRRRLLKWWWNETPVHFGGRRDYCTFPLH